MAVCRDVEPPLLRLSDDRMVACHLHDPEQGAAAAAAAGSAEG